MKFQILICSLEKRRSLLDRLLKVIYPQLTDGVCIKVNTDNGEKSIGQKRNELLQQSPAEYVAYVDDDDLLSDNYVKLILEGIEKGVDACSLTGIITENGLNPKKFIHSNRYDSWFEKDGVYYRNTNHLNCIKSSIAKQFIFPEKNFGEDHDFSKQLLRSGLIKNEHWIESTIYHYDYQSNK